MFLVRLDHAIKCPASTKIYQNSYGADEFNLELPTVRYQRGLVRNNRFLGGSPRAYAARFAVSNNLGLEGICYALRMN